MAKLKETTSLYDDYKTELTKNLDEIEQKLESGNFDSVSAVDAQMLAGELKSIVQDVEAQTEKIGCLKSVAEELFAILEALECRDTPKGRAIENTVSTIETRYGALQQSILSKQKKFDDKILQLFQQWVQKTKKQFNEMKPQSVDRDTLNEQIQHHRDITAEIESHLTEINAMKERHQDRAAQVKKYKTLTDNLTALGVRAKQRGEALESTIQKLEPFHLAVYQLESWYGYAAHALKQERIDMEFLFTKIDNIYEQREQKKAQLDTVFSIRDEILKDTDVADKDKLEAQVEELQAKWDEVGQQLIKLISSAAVLKMESFSKYFEKAAKDLESAETPSPEADIVMKQYTDHQILNNDLKSNLKSAVDTVNKYKSMYKALSGEDPTEIQAKWSAVHKECASVTKRSEERLGVLEEAQPAQLSADIDMDEVLQDWIEVDTVEGELEKKRLKKANEAEAKKKADAKKRSEAAAGKPTQQVKKPEGQKEESAKAKKDDKVHKKSSESKDSQKKKQSNTKKTKAVDTNDKKVVKPEEEQPKAVESKPKQMTKPAESVKSNSASASSSTVIKGKETKKTAEKEKDFPVVLDKRARQHINSKYSEFGVVITNFKDGGTRRAHVLDFVRPYCKKIGLIKFCYIGKKNAYIFVGVATHHTAKRLVQKVDGRTLCGKRVDVKMAAVTFLDENETPKQGDKKNNGTIFDTPTSAANAHHHKPDTERKRPAAVKKSSNKVSVSGKKPGVLSLEEAKSKTKQNELLKMMKKKRQAREILNLGKAANSRKPHKPGGKEVLSLSELRAAGRRAAVNLHRRTLSSPAGIPSRVPRAGRISPRRSPGRPPHTHRAVVPKPSMLPPRPPVIPRHTETTKELERERQRVWLEHERLERERLQAERERVALERERNRRSITNLFQDEDIRQSVKRTISPGPSSSSRSDGSYWMQPKRPALDRDFRRGADMWHARRLINPAHDDHTLSHLRFDDMRPKSYPLSSDTRQVIDAPGLSSHEIRRSIPDRRYDDSVRRVETIRRPFESRRVVETTHRRSESKGSHGHSRSHSDGRHSSRWPRQQGGWS